MGGCVSKNGHKANLKEGQSSAAKHHAVHGSNSTLKTQVVPVAQIPHPSNSITPQKPPRRQSTSSRTMQNGKESSRKSVTSSTSSIPPVIMRNNPGGLEKYKFKSIRGPLATTIPVDYIDGEPSARSSYLTPISAPQQQNNPTQTRIIPIEIKKNQRLFTPGSGPVPMYTTNGRKRGVSLIINNTIFKDKPTRTGADIDSVNVYNLLQGLGLNPKTKTNLSVKEIKQNLKGFAGIESLRKREEADMCVVVIMTYGRGSTGKATEIMGNDGKWLKVTDILTYFSSGNCKRFADKPKIFIIQCSRDEDEKKGDEYDAVPMDWGDMYVAYSTLPGCASKRSLFISEICKVFMEFSCEMHLEDMFKRVCFSMEQSGNEQRPHCENYHFKQCYLNPV